MLRDFIYNHEPLWLFVILLAGLLVELHSNYMLRKEYEYDKAKDDRRKRTRTTKKTTSKADGDSVVEESTEVSEPVGEPHERREPEI